MNTFKGRIKIRVLPSSSEGSIMIKVNKNAIRLVFNTELIKEAFRLAIYASSPANIVKRKASLADNATNRIVQKIKQILNAGLRQPLCPAFVLFWRRRVSFDKMVSIVLFKKASLSEGGT